MAELVSEGRLLLGMLNGYPNDRIILPFVRDQIGLLAAKAYLEGFDVADLLHCTQFLTFRETSESTEYKELMLKAARQCCDTWVTMRKTEQ